MKAQSEVGLDMLNEALAIYEKGSLVMMSKMESAQLFVRVDYRRVAPNIFRMMKCIYNSSSQNLLLK